MIQKPNREATAPEEFVDHCSKIVCSVCAICGGSELIDVDLVNNKGRCLNRDCEGRQGNGSAKNGVVPLAPAMTSIYGELGIRDGGTGEQSDGKPSASAVRRKILEERPVGRRIGERPPAIREWSMAREVANSRGRRSDQ